MDLLQHLESLSLDDKPELPPRPTDAASDLTAGLHSLSLADLDSPPDAPTEKVSLIGCLAGELLGEIFEWIAGPVFPPDHNGTLPRIPAFTLSAVCRHWRDLSLAISALWRVIDLSTPAHIGTAKMCIERSGSHELYIRIGQEIVDQRIFTELITAPVAARVRVLDLWVSFRIDAPAVDADEASATLLELFDLFPRIENLRLESSFLHHYQSIPLTTPRNLKTTTTLQVYCSDIDPHSVEYTFRPPVQTFPFPSLPLLSTALGLPALTRIDLANGRPVVRPARLASLSDTALPILASVTELRLRRVDTRTDKAYDDTPSARFAYFRLFAALPNVAALTLSMCDLEDDARPWVMIDIYTTCKCIHEDAAHSEVPWPEMRTLTLNRRPLNPEFLLVFLRSRSLVLTPIHTLRLAREMVNDWRAGKLEEMRQYVECVEVIDDDGFAAWE